MRLMKGLSLILPALVLLAGCASRLGYPAKTVGIPTSVTLYSKAAPRGIINNTMPFAARDIWNAIYQKQFENVLAKIPVTELHRVVDVRFSNNVSKAIELFAPSSSEVMDITMDYATAKTDPPAYSGFDFSGQKDAIPTQYILALTLDDWGLLAAQRKEDNGAFISLTMQLIDKETNMSAWRYHYQFLQQVDKDANELTKPELLQHILEKLIERAVDQYFLWLSFK